MSHSPEYKESMYLLYCCGRIMDGPRLDEEQMAIYFKAVDISDGQAVVAALQHWLRNERRFPVPADIRQTIVQMKEGEPS